MLFSLYFMCYCKATTIIRCMVFNYFTVKSCGIFVIVDQNWCPLSIWTVGQIQPNSSHWRGIGCCGQVCREELPQPFISAYRSTGQSIIVATNPLLKSGMLSLFYLHNTTYVIRLHLYLLTPIKLIIRSISLNFSPRQMIVFYINLYHF